ncbi:hypothetical protein HanPSC8_Chr13g0588161 [Helianthus annuus]|nr:hypothetical protein HanPSC8_Chr13g0588161 [Helianthus annuus]
MRLLYFHHAPVLAGHAPWWAMEASTVLSFLLLPGHAPVFAGHGACSDSVSSLLSWEVPLRVRAVHFCSFSCIYARISCLFASFVILSSFHPENTKGRQKHSFSNIST